MRNLVLCLSILIGISTIQSATIQVRADQSPELTDNKDSVNSSIRATDLASPATMLFSFTKNMGQWPDSILFRGAGSGATMWVTRDGIYYELVQGIGKRQPSGVGLTTNLGPRGPQLLKPFVCPPDSLESTLIKAEFIGASKTTAVLGLKEIEYKCNFFLGNDPTWWRVDVPNYAGITFVGLYPGVDISIYFDNGRLECQQHAASSAALSQVRTEYRGIRARSLTAEGLSIVQTDCGQSVFRGVLLEEIVAPDSSSASSVLAKGNVTLEYSTYLGGSSSDAAYAITADGSGNAYIAGWTNSVDFPTKDPTQTHHGLAGSYDAFVTKMSADGTNLIYSTYLGGTRNDGAWGIKVDGSGSVYVVGAVLSADFPTRSPFQVYQGPSGFYDAFVTKLSVGGNSLVYSSYLGGNDNEQAWAITVDGSGSAYVAGSTSSTNYPMQSPYQTYQGGGDAFVTKLSTSGTSIDYSTYIGGSDRDEALSIAVDGTGSAFVAGYSNSGNFPTQNPYQGYQGGSDVFVTKLSGGGSSLIYSSYIGGSTDDIAGSIAVDGQGNAYIAGWTSSTNFPVQSPYQTDQPGDDAFVTKLSPTGDSLAYSTYLGGSGNDYANCLALDSADLGIVAGGTESVDFPTVNPNQSNQGSTDVFVTQFSSGGSSLLHSTYLGGNNDDFATAIAVDSRGGMYTTGVTYSSDYLTIAPFRGTYSGGGDAFVTKLVERTNCGSGPDADGDGLLDVWEEFGYDSDGNGSVDVDLPAMGADPCHKDIFVEIDWMASGPLEAKSHKPARAALMYILGAFANAPITNPDGSTGIMLHIDTGQGELFDGGNEIPHQDVLGDGTGDYIWDDFDALKSANFASARQRIFRYCIFAHRYGANDNSSSGVARGIPASDFLVTLGGWPSNPGSPEEQGGTFMHELGHTLGLRHGGGDDENYKPNFLSVMNYYFQTSGLRINGRDQNYDYSRFTLPSLDENHLNESVGINGGPVVNSYGTKYFCLPSWRAVNWANDPIDFDCNGNHNETDVRMSVDGNDVYSVLTGFDEWPILSFRGGLVGTGLSQNELPRVTTSNELTYEENQKIACCYDRRGNVDSKGSVDLADLSALVSYLTGGGFVVPCVASANVNAFGGIDLADLSALVTYLTGGGYVLPSCP